MSIFSKSIVAVHVEDDGFKTMERLETQLGMENISFVYIEGATQLVLEKDGSEIVRLAPLGSYVYRSDEDSKFYWMSGAELVEKYGKEIPDTLDFATRRNRNLFISCPMRNRSESDILDERERLERVAEAYFDETFDVIDSYISDSPPKDLESDSQACWYLGKAIEKLSIANVAIFGKGWMNARGCRIEREVCRLYNIPVLEADVFEPDKPYGSADEVEF